MNTSDHGTKSDLQWTFELCLPKKNFALKNNQDRVANHDFHEDRLSFPVYGEKINLGYFRPILRLAVLKVQNFRRN
jgi:hypothetical protein